MASGGFLRYVKKAFMHHWNLLVLGAGTVAGFVSGRPDIVLPLVGAAELVYLAGLCSHPKFQAAVQAEDHKAEREAASKLSAGRVQQIIGALPSRDRESYDRLRGLLVDLRQLAAGLKGGEAPLAFDDLQRGKINHLLWTYLKLLYSKCALERFFDTIDEVEILRGLEKTKKRLAALGKPEDDNPDKQKRRKSLDETLTAAQARLDNYNAARSRHEFIELELDRLYTTITSLGEMGVSRQDPNQLTTEVESVVESFVQTEKAMGELEHLTGLSSQETDPPALLDTDPPTQIES